MERIYVPSQVSKEYSSGVTVHARRVAEPKRPSPGETAFHESAHIVAAGEIVMATIIPSGNALGSTQPRRMTAEAAAAADALGFGGVGHDRLVVMALGSNPNDARSAARSVLSGKEEEMLEVATILQERKTISQADVDKARENVQNRRNGVYPVEVEIISPEGQSTVVTKISSRGEIKIEDGLLKPTKQQESPLRMIKL